MKVRLPRGLATLLTGAAVAVVISACGGNDSEPPTVTPVPELPQDTPTPPPPPVVGPVVWATGVVTGTNAPQATVESFSIDAPMIFAVVRLENVRSGAVLSAAWTYEGVPISQATSGFITGAFFNAGYVEFHLAKSAERDWPRGTYAVAVSLDGAVVAEGNVEVDE